MFWQCQACVGVLAGPWPPVPSGDRFPIGTETSDLICTWLPTPEESVPSERQGRLHPQGVSDERQESRDPVRVGCLGAGLVDGPAGGNGLAGILGRQNLAERHRSGRHVQHERIAEDHLRILRFYRFAARFGHDVLDPASHAAVVAARHSLKSLSRERIADELTRIAKEELA